MAVLDEFFDDKNSTNNYPVGELAKPERNTSNRKPFKERLSERTDRKNDESSYCVNEPQQDDIFHLRVKVTLNLKSSNRYLT